MKKIISITSILLLLTLSVSITNAATIGGSKITIINSSTKIQESKLSLEEIFTFFAKYYENQVPESFKYIKVNYIGIQKGSSLEKSLQKLIYLDLIKNPRIQIKPETEISAWAFFRLSEKILGIKINDAESKKQLLNRTANKTDIISVSNFVGKTNISIDSKTSNKEINQKIAIFKDVYKTILLGHYNKDNLDEGEIIDSAIEGITKGTKDKHTVYFPPIESENFHDSLSGDYEGIGSYVDMEKPGAVRIVSPIPGSPSEKAGLKGGDLIIKVDGKEITKENSLREVIRWIKGPALSEVILTINRDDKIFDIKVIRDRIIITDIESEILNYSTYYLQIKSFGEHVSEDFEKSLLEISKNKNINKIIIDLRNNGGGYLNQVAEMLSYFIEKDQKTAIVKYHDSEKTFLSRGYDLIDLNDYTVVVLQNSGTASASEILIGTLKDYYPNITLIGEKTYGKGSVQVMKNYKDGSLLKYTIAKWFTGLTETGIDQIGIEPTIKIEFDIEKFKKNGFDNQLDKAIFIK